MNTMFNFSHLIVFAFLFFAMLIYLKIARKYHIINKPSTHSSHNYVAIRGGGIVFWLAGILFSLAYLPQSLCFFAGFTLICCISFWDDISSLSIGLRLIVHFIAVGLILYCFNVHCLLPWWGILIASVVCVGIINGYNFMDGINGITGCYSLVLLGSLQYINQKIVPFTEPDFINYAILASVVFLIFNFRKKAKCFAGDVGSIAISFWIVALLIQLTIETKSFVWILFLAVYGVDVVCTILHRIYLKQNILESHRLHFYQILSNEGKISHLKVSVIYAITQLIICTAVIYVYQTQKLDLTILFTASLLPLFLIYLLKFRF